MVSDNNRLRDTLGVTAWHNAGYTGKGVTVASGERWSYDTDQHGWKTAHTFLEVAPNAELISLPWEGVVNDVFGLEVTTGIKTNNVSVFWASIASSFTLPESAEARFTDVTDRCVLMLAGGNKNSQTEGARVIESPSIWGVNACICMVDGRINPAYYNFNSKHIDFCAPEGWTLPTGSRFTGTSAATPALAGMATLVQQMAYEQLNRALSADELHAFFEDCAKAVGSKQQCGFGLPILPPPDKVNLTNYVKESTISNEGKAEVLNTYESLDDIPTWAFPTIKKLVDLGALQGDGNGLNLSQDMLRILVILDRLGKL